METDLYKQTPNQILKKVNYDKYIIYNEDNSCICKLNQTAYAIWKLCDGDHDINEIADELSSIYNINKTYILPKISNVIEKLKALNLIRNGEESD